MASSMEKVYNHKIVEEKIYENWEKNGYFKPEINPNGKPYCIILPPPNANGALHFGHAMFAVEDILIRYHRMKGDSTLWLPGTDHAGIETQFVFEKKLASLGKTRMDYDRETLFKMIEEYVNTHRGGIEKQLKRLGFSLDWSREKYTLDKDIVKLVHKTFKKMYDDGLVYRGLRLVNYCTFDGTSFSDLEVLYEEKKAPLYYIKYGPFTIATVRPETKFRDTALAVNPNDPRFKDKIGMEYTIQGLLGNIKMKIIPDANVDPNFGTGIMKVTPAHDSHDFELAQKHNLAITPIIGKDGKMDFSWFLERKDVEQKYRKRAEKYHGKFVKEVRRLMIEDLNDDGLLLKTDESYVHRIGLCYKCKNVLEPLPMEQWFVRVEALKKKAIEVVRNREIKIFPKRFEYLYFDWLENLKDWNISRQIVWGIRIPAWKCFRCVQNQISNIKNKKYKSKIKNTNGKVNQFNNGEWIVTNGAKPEKCPVCGSTDLEQDPDTFDTWFSSGQWPIITLMSGSNEKLKIKNEKLYRERSDFEKFYPTNVMETGYDLLRAWVSRMVMLGIYVTGKVPFKQVLFHGIVNDPYGKKMSKSKGNVVNPLELIDKYGADSVRFALIYGNATGNDQSLSYSKLEAARKFANKLWNMARFIEMKREIRNSKFEIRNLGTKELLEIAKNDKDKEMIKKIQQLINQVTKYLDSYNFNYAAEALYDFSWHEFADNYIEDVKNRIDSNLYFILHTLYFILLKLLHPFMPFITEEIYQRLSVSKSIMISTWPE